MHRRMSRMLSLIITLLLLASTVPAIVLAESTQLVPNQPPPTAETGEFTDETGRFWFVELNRAPAVDGSTQAALAQEKNAFRQEARAAGLDYKERFAFGTLWNGLSIEIDPAELNKLSHISGVKNIYPVVEFAYDPVVDISPELSTALAMTGADIAQSELGYTGAGVRVAVMDTGVDYDHPDLGGCFGPGCRVAVGWDFVGDDFNADPNSAGYNPVPVPGPDPDDCNGHGTHVAGIVGANGETVGVAPDVTFGAYRVFGCEGSTLADIMIAAMERAFADKMDVLNMSIGSAFTWPQYPTAQAADRLVKRGMVVVASIGNSGANGLYSAGAPGLGENVIGVASFDNSHINALTFNVNPGGQQVPYLQLSTTADAPTSGTSPEVVWVGRGCQTTVPPDPYLADPAGKIALIERGECTFDEKYQRAVNAGAAGVVIHNNVTGLFAGGGVINRGVFGIGISQADGLHIRGLLTAGETVTIDWTDVRLDAPNPTGGLISSFSSYGLAPDLTLKPDIGAPGGLIRSTYPLDLGGYATVSGTSMAAPHVAGGVALLLEAHPKTKAMDVRDILQNTADPKPWWGNPGLGFLDNVHRQGAGMLNIAAAIETGVHVTPAKLSLGESESGPVTRQLQIQNKSGQRVTYDLSHVPALATGPDTFAPGFFGAFASAAFDKQTVTLPPNGKATVKVTITAPAGPVNGQYGGYVVLTSEDGATYQVPYAGYIGDYQARQAMGPSLYGFPWLVSLVGDTYFDQPDGATYSMVDGDIPYLLVHLSHQSQNFRVKIHSLDSNRNWHYAYDIDHMSRNSTSTGFFALPWDGTTLTGNRIHEVPDGQYVLEIQVLKALGNKNNADHWETWNSPVITIARP